MLGGSLSSRGPGGLPPGRGLGGLGASVMGLGGFPGCPGNEGVGVILGGPLSLRGGGGAPDFTGELAKKILFSFASSKYNIYRFWTPISENAKLIYAIKCTKQRSKPESQYTETTSDLTLGAQ